MKPISWDEYFIKLAQVSGMRSKDPNTQVGATLVDSKNKVIALGYNDMPLGNDDFPWEREADEKVDTKYPYVVHAEVNALLNATVPTDGSKLYVSLFPCSDCAKMLVQAGIKEIIFSNDKYKDTEDNLISKKIFNEYNIKYRQI